MQKGQRQSAWRKWPYSSYQKIWWGEYQNSTIEQGQKIVQSIISQRKVMFLTTKQSKKRCINHPHGPLASSKLRMNYNVLTVAWLLITSFFMGWLDYFVLLNWNKNCSGNQHDTSNHIHHIWTNHREGVSYSPFRKEYPDYQNPGHH